MAGDHNSLELQRMLESKMLSEEEEELWGREKLHQFPARRCKIPLWRYYRQEPERLFWGTRPRGHL